MPVELIGGQSADPSLILRLLRVLIELPPEAVYLVVGLGAAIENVVPPVPADTFVVLGAFLSAQGRATILGVFLATWLCNVASALIVYGLGRRWGRGFFATAAGRWLLRPRQLARLSALYDAHGFKIIFVSRFLPGFRAVVPVFAGISRLVFWRTALPLTLASAIWYGLLVYLGAMFGRNLGVILETLENVNTVLLIVALAVAVLVGVLWWRSRYRAYEHAGGEHGEG